VKVKCAICGYEAIVVREWWKNKSSLTPHYNVGKSPEIWICDIHQGEF